MTGVRKNENARDSHHHPSRQRAAHVSADAPLHDGIRKDCCGRLRKAAGKEKGFLQDIPLDARQGEGTAGNSARRTIMIKLFIGFGKLAYIEPEAEQDEGYAD